MKPYMTIINCENKYWINWNRYNNQADAIEGRTELLKKRYVEDVKIIDTRRKDYRFYTDAHYPNGIK